MNKVVSLPRIRSNSEFSRPLLTNNRKKSIEYRQQEGLDGQNIKKAQNEEQKLRKKPQNRSVTLKKVNSELLSKVREQKQQDGAIQKRYGLQQNGKLSKITQSSTVSKVIGTQRSKSSRVDSYEKQQVGQIRKQLNEITSSILILKKQIKAIQGGTVQIKEQIRNIQEKDAQSHLGIEQKIEEVRKKTDWSKYDQDVLKTMKDRLKKIIIHFEKKTLDQKGELQRQEKRVKILKQRTSIRQESINKQKMQFRNLEEKQKTANKLVQISVKDYQKRLKQLNDQSSLAKKHDFKHINQDEYHYEVYKRQEKQLYNQLLTHYFIQGMLDVRWNKYSIIYEKVEKAEKLMEMHCLDKGGEEFNPKTVYFGSFENKKVLQDKIREKQNILSKTMKRNAQLQAAWDSIQFKEIDEQEKIIDQKAMPIKTGKIEEKQIIQKQNREYLAQIRKKLEVQKQRAAKISRIKDWVLKLQQNLQIKTPNKSKLQDRLLDIIEASKKEHKLLKNKNNKTF